MPPAKKIWKSESQMRESENLPPAKKIWKSESQIRESESLPPAKINLKKWKSNERKWKFATCQIKVRGESEILPHVKKRREN